MPAPKKNVMAGYRLFKTQWTPCKLPSCSCKADDAHGHFLVVIETCLLSRDRDEDEGVPCESEFEKKVSDAKVRGLKGKSLLGTELGSGFWKIYKNCFVGLCGWTVTFFKGVRILHPANNCNPYLTCVVFFLSLLGAIAVQDFAEHRYIIRVH